jgi:hypothetical protein
MSTRATRGNRSRDNEIKEEKDGKEEVAADKEIRATKHSSLHGFKAYYTTDMGSFSDWLANDYEPACERGQWTDTEKVRGIWGYIRNPATTVVGQICRRSHEDCPGQGLGYQLLHMFDEHLPRGQTVVQILC